LSHSYYNATLSCRYEGTGTVEIVKGDAYNKLDWNIKLNDDMELTMGTDEECDDTPALMPDTEFTYNSVYDE